MPHSVIEGLMMRGIRMHQRYGVNLLAVAREGRASLTRLQNVRFRVGDVLLLQGETQALEIMCANLGDYWRMGLPLDMVIVVVGVPMTIWVWL